MKRQYSSGASKRRKAAAEEERKAKLPKVTTFFKSVTTNLTKSTDNQNEIAPSVETIQPEQSVGANEDQRIPKSSSIADSSKSNTDERNNTISPSTDPAMWDPIDNNLRTHCLLMNPSVYQNMDADFRNSARVYTVGDKSFKRSFNPKAFKRTLQNGEKIYREWLLYSPSQNSIYCFVCRLFSNSNSSFSKNGFNDWRNTFKCISQHENGQEHRKCMLTYCSRRKEAGCIDNELSNQMENEQQYWHQVLRRIVAVVKFLASRGLSFRGQNQIIGSPHNGNYLGALDLLSQFDPFLEEHLKKYGNAGKGATSYLSANICEEFIAIISDKVLSSILTELKKAKYYSLSVDSTPDLCHVDQLTFTVRYVNDQGPIERFLGFTPIFSHKAQNLVDVIFKFLEEKHISISDCRGQSYDNASNMAGRYTGVQARVKELNEFSVFVPCAGHSLNLVGANAVNCCTQVVIFFGFVQRLYTFFSVSTYRWNVLVTYLGKGKVPKSRCDTRWSADELAVQALFEGYSKIQSALNSLANDETQPMDTAHEARALEKKMDKLETVFLVVLWVDILNSFGKANKTIQKSNADLSIVVNLINSLKGYLTELRDKFDEYETKAKAICKEAEYSDKNRRLQQRSSRITWFEGAATDTVHEGNQKFRLETYLPVIDSLSNELTRRGEAYISVNNKFGFFTTLTTMGGEEIAQQCKNLASFYHKDLDAEELILECQHFKHYISASEATTGGPFLLEGEETEKNSHQVSVSSLFLMIKNDKLESTFPNIEIALRIFLCMMVTNCCGERSFSKLKLIKNELRNRMHQSRLNCLSLMSIESEILLSIDFTDIIAEFAACKTRRRTV